MDLQLCRWQLHMNPVAASDICETVCGHEIKALGRKVQVASIVSSSIVQPLADTTQVLNGLKSSHWRSQSSEGSQSSEDVAYSTHPRLCMTLLILWWNGKCMGSLQSPWAHLVDFPDLIDYYVIFGFWPMASKSARMRWSANPKVVTLILYSPPWLVR